MPRKDYPTPCIRPSAAQAILGADSIDIPWVYEAPSGLTTTFTSELEAKEYVLDNKIHRKYGRCFIEVAPKRFAVLIADDGDEDESEPQIED